MPLPQGAHYEKGTRQKYIILSSGTRVTRYQGLKLGAQKLGFRSEKEYNAFSKRVKKTKYYQARKKQAVREANRQNLKGEAKRKFLLNFDQIESKIFLMQQQEPDEPLDKDPDTIVGQHMQYIGKVWNPRDEKWESPTNDSGI